jgi:hypothetical protein
MVIQAKKTKEAPKKAKPTMSKTTNKSPSQTVIQGLKVGQAKQPKGVKMTPKLVKTPQSINSRQRLGKCAADA